MTTPKILLPQSTIVKKLMPTWLLCNEHVTVVSLKYNQLITVKRKQKSDKTCKVLDVVGNTRESMLVFNAIVCPKQWSFFHVRSD